MRAPERAAPASTAASSYAPSTVRISMAYASAPSSCARLHPILDHDRSVKIGNASRRSPLRAAGHIGTMPRPVCRSAPLLAWICSAYRRRSRDRARRAPTACPGGTRSARSSTGSPTLERARGPLGQRRARSKLPPSRFPEQQPVDRASELGARISAGLEPARLLQHRYRQWFEFWRPSVAAAKQTRYGVGQSGGIPSPSAPAERLGGLDEKGESWPRTTLTRIAARRPGVERRAASSARTGGGSATWRARPSRSPPRARQGRGRRARRRQCRHGRSPRCSPCAGCRDPRRDAGVPRARPVRAAGVRRPRRTRRRTRHGGDATGRARRARRAARSRTAAASRASGNEWCRRSPRPRASTCARVLRSRRAPTTRRARHPRSRPGRPPRRSRRTPPAGRTRFARPARGASTTIRRSRATSGGVRANPAGRR